MFITCSRDAEKGSAGAQADAAGAELRAELTKARADAEKARSELQTELGKARVSHEQDAKKMDSLTQEISTLNKKITDLSAQLADEK